MEYSDPKECAPEFKIILSDVEQPQAHDFISRQLDEFNNSITCQPDNKTLDVLITDPTTKEVKGGLIGRTSLGLFFINLLFIPQSLRKTGVGSKLLEEAEKEARRRGCVRAVLYTISFQAPGFYIKHGYKAFGEIPCLPKGTSRIFMDKEL